MTRRLKRPLHCYLTSVLIFFLSATPGMAEEPSGHLRGRTLQKILSGGDSEIRRLPLATIRMTHQETGEKQIFACGEEGRFAFPDLRPGTYMLEGRREGYRSARRTVEIESGVLTEIDLTLLPGVDLEEALRLLTPREYESLVFQVYSPQTEPIRLEIAITPNEARVRMGTEIAEMGEASFERRLSDENLSKLRELLAQAEPMTSNHRGSYARPPDLPFETLEILAAGLMAVVVVSGNPDFEEGPGRRLIEFLYSLPDTLVKRVR